MAPKGRKLRWLAAPAVLAAVAFGSSPAGKDVAAKTRIIGSDRIVSWIPIADESGVMCPMPEPSLDEPSFQGRGGGGGQGRGGAVSAPPPGVSSYVTPDRVVRDRFPSFSSIAVDLARNQIVVTDENLFQILFYDRTENNAPSQIAKPRRVIGTPWDASMMKREESRTKIEFQCGLYIDPRPIVREAWARSLCRLLSRSERK